MTTKTVPQKLGWIKVKRITIEITENTKKGVYCRIYGTYLINNKEIKEDMFPLNKDFFIGPQGRLILESNKNFKILGKISIT